MAANSSPGSFLLHLLLLLSSASCFSTAQEQISSDSSTPVSSQTLNPRLIHGNGGEQGLLFAEKARLGSIPPSCHNKCNQCHPCMAVQVPSLPSNSPLRPALTAAAIPMEFFDSSPPSAAAGNRYSNYKPLGWKCHCGGHFFNP